MKRTLERAVKHANISSRMGLKQKPPTSDNWWSFSESMQITDQWQSSLGDSFCQKFRIQGPITCFFGKLFNTNMSRPRRKSHNFHICSFFFFLEVKQEEFSIQEKTTKIPIFTSNLHPVWHFSRFRIFRTRKSCSSSTQKNKFFRDFRLRFSSSGFQVHSRVKCHFQFVV